MKRMVSIVLVLCLLMGLCGCGEPIKVKKFGSEEEMKEYVQGVWGNDIDEEVIFIIGDRINFGNLVRVYVDKFEYALTDDVVEKGYEAATQIEVKDYVAELEEEWMSWGSKECEFDPKKGTITYKYDGAEQIIYVGEDEIYTDTTIARLSDTPSYTCPELIGCFEDALENFAPEAEDVMRTNEQYAKALMELHPEIKNYSVVKTNDETHFYTDTGSNKYNYGLMWTDNSVLYVKRSQSTDKYTLLLTKDSTLSIQDTHHLESWETLAADALALFPEVPGIPTPEELVAEFREKAEKEVYHGLQYTSTLYKYKTEIGGITCEMTESHGEKSNYKMFVFRF